jgi:hypothetical protein
MGRNPKFSKQVKVEACKKYNNDGDSFKISKEISCDNEILRQLFHFILEKKQ